MIIFYKNLKPTVFLSWFTTSRSQQCDKEIKNERSVANWVCAHFVGCKSNFAWRVVLDKDELSNCRPISNLSIIYKIIERVVKSRLIDHLTYIKLLNSH